MPRLACWSCGRQIYTVAPLEALFAEERRCPRCGAFMDRERRDTERRERLRRQNPAEGPPLRRPQRAEDKGGVLGEFGLSEEQGNEIIMAARAHWFEDEGAPAAAPAAAEEAADAESSQ